MASMETATSSGLLAASTLVATRRAKLMGITLLQASAASTVIVYDNNAAAASGTVLAQVNNNTNTSTATLYFNFPVEANKGLYAVITGTGANIILHYALM